MKKILVILLIAAHVIEAKNNGSQDDYNNLNIIPNDTSQSLEDYGIEVKTRLGALPIQQKDWSVFIYIASDNDLNYFAKRNLDDMKKIGSTNFVNIVAQVDGQGPTEKTKRFYVEKNTLVHVNKNDTGSHQKLDFGSAHTLVDFCSWGKKNFPSKHSMLILWNHGIGILDSIGGKTSNASELFVFNPSTTLLEINRAIEFIKYAKEREEERILRGICFSDSFGTYLTNQKLIYALNAITKQTNSRFDIIAFDACLMAMLEVGDLLAPFADIMVGSQELELGAGYPYHKVFEPFLTDTLTPEQFGKHIVNIYSQHYKNITSDYTLSAVNLITLGRAEAALEKTVCLLLEALKYQKNSSVSRLIKASRSRRLCTCFSEPTYIDLYDFLTNMLESTDYMIFLPHKETLRDELHRAIIETQNLLNESVIANEVGKNLERAHGLSIYFPYRSIDPSYTQTPFANSSSWLQLVKYVM